MLPWLLLVSLLAVVGLTASGALAVRRYSSSHVVAQLAVGGRGLFFSRTPDGVWWRLRLRPCWRLCEDRSGWGELPPGMGVREPRRPQDPGPLAGWVELDPASLLAQPVGAGGADPRGDISSARACAVV